MIQNHYSGKLIAIDGPNGVGKSTIMTKLKDSLTQYDIPIYFTREPSETEMGVFTRKFAEKNSGIPLACMVTADRYYHVENEIIPKLQEGFWVFTDRYVLSSLILQGMDGVDASLIYKMNETVIKPDLQIVVWAKVNTLQARLKERKTLTRFEKDEQSSKELRFMAAGVEILESDKVNCLHINNDNNLHENILYIIKSILELRGRNEEIYFN